MKRMKMNLNKMTMADKKLQLKRVTANWEAHKTYKPEDGEPVFIEVDNSFSIGGNQYSTKQHPILVIGSDNSTLENLISNMDSNSNGVYLPFSLIKSWVGENLSALSPSTNVTPGNVGVTSSLGNSTSFAKADHTHKIEKSTIESVLGVNSDTSEFRCRRIRIGSDDPNVQNVQGETGDIYIIYDD